MSEDVPADEGATQFEECFVNVGATLKANAKTMKVVEACMSTLGHSAEFAEAFTTSIRRIVSSILGD